jgi:hypothetical protein
MAFNFHAAGSRHKSNGPFATGPRCSERSSTFPPALPAPASPPVYPPFAALAIHFEPSDPHPGPLPSDGRGRNIFWTFYPGGAPRVIPGATIFGPNGAPHFAALCAVGGARSRNNPVVKRSPGSTELAEVSSLPSTARRRRADLAPGVDWSGPPLQSPRLRMNAISGFQRHSAELPPRDSGFLGFFICWLTQSGLWRKIQELVGGVGKSPKSQVQRPKVLAHRSFRTGTMGARSLTIESDVETLNR